MYRTIKISEIANLKYGKMPDKKKVSDDGYPIFTGYKVSGYYPEYNIEENTLVVVARGVGGTGDVKYVEEKSYLTNLSISLELKDDEANKKYLYYLLNQSNLRILDSGSAQSQITIRDLSDFILTLPSLNYQNSVANILSSFDDKIENNNAIIANLEEQAQAIFKSWFVDFEPFQDEQFIKSDIGLIPKTGKVVSLDNIAEVIMGVSPKSETYNNNNIGLPLLNGAADFAENSLKPTRHTSDPKRISQQGDWILCIRGTIGNLAYSDGEYALGRGVAAIRPLEQSCQSIIYHYILLNIKQLKRNATGSVISGLSKTDLTKMKVFIPEKTKLNHISNVLLRILKYQIKLEAINETLSSIRDILLPKLMSGEIRVEEAIEVEKV